MRIIQFISDRVRESLGNPVRVRGFLAKHPSFKADRLAPEDNIDMARIPKWHRLQQSGSSMAARRSGRFELMGWRTQGSHYSSFISSCPALGSLVRKVIFDAWSCDLQDVHGFAASKSDLKSFRSMDRMVETNSKEMIDDLSTEALRRNLAHDEIRLIGENPSDWLQVHQWDTRMFVVNSGGSHHLAAAKYIAARIGVPVLLRAPLHYYAIDPGAVALLRAQYDVYLVNNMPELANAFDDTMRSCKATWLWHGMPQPYGKVRAIFLPREEKWSMRVSEAFADAGFVELGQHLEGVAHSGMPEVIERNLRAKALNDVDNTVQRPTSFMPPSP